METLENEASTPTSEEKEPKIAPTWMTRAGKAIATVWTSYPISLVFGAVAIIALFLDVFDGGFKDTPEPMMLGLKVPATLVSLFLGVALDMLRSTRERLNVVSRRSDEIAAANEGALRLVEAIHKDTEHVISARKDIESHRDDCLRAIGKHAVDYTRKQRFNISDEYLTVSTPHLSYQAYIGFWRYCEKEQRKVGRQNGPVLEIKALHVWSPQFWTTRTGAEVLDTSKQFIDAGGSLERILVQRTHRQDKESIAQLLDVISRMTSIGIDVYYINREALDLTPESFAVVSHPNGNQYSVSLHMDYKPREPIKAFIRKNSPEVRSNLRAWNEVKRVFLEQGNMPFTRDNPATEEAIVLSSPEIRD